ncbi:MAG: hypothetical protein AB7I19_08645 [Planctomycetota bacterium]
MKLLASVAFLDACCRLSLLVLLALVSGCGGGGGSSARVVPRIGAEEVTLAPGVRTGDLEIAFLGDPPLPTLAQIDLLYPPSRVRFGEPSTIGTSIAVAGHTVVDGRYRLVFGDTSSADAAQLPTGKLVRIPFTVEPTVAAGTDLTITFENSVGATSEGTENSTESAPGVTTIRVR